MSSVLVFENDRYSEYPISSEYERFEKNKFYSKDGKFVLVHDAKNISYENKTTIVIGDVDYADIRVNTKSVVVIEDGKVRAIEGRYYLNGVCKEEEGKLRNFDLILVETIKITYSKEVLTISGENYLTSLNRVLNRVNEIEDYPDYKRAARHIKRSPEDVVAIKSPKSKVKQTKGNLLKMVLPPLVTMAGTIAVGVILGRGIYMYVMALSCVITTTFSITSFFQNKREQKQEEINRKEQYERYLLKIRKELYSLKEKQYEAEHYQNPTSSEITKLIEMNSNRLYERNMLDADFLDINVGSITKESSYKIKYDNDEFKYEEDEVYKDIQNVVNNFTTIENMPYVISLQKSNLGLVGNREHLYPWLKDILSQICFLQSYHDVEIVFLTDEVGAKEFSYLRFAPHLRIKAINVLGLISDEKHKDQVLGNLTSILKQRRDLIDEKKKEVSFSNYYLFVIDNSKLVVNHQIMEFLQEERLDMGFRIIYLSSLESNVPENIKTVCIANSISDGKVRLVNGELINKNIRLHEAKENYELQVRRIYPINHIKGMKNRIPSSISYLDMMDVESVEELKIGSRWQKNSCHKSLEAPIGLKGQKDILTINLHEKAHGPHGLIAGTTGSGKSELIQTLILSLAVNYSPYDVGFLLIDYKGGGMANMFEDLPHLLGTITNLDKNESSRALVSIKAELNRRQILFSENKINNINQYTKLFKEGKVKEALPHLFIISDEFAELKKEQPEFMSELITTARIGRSLGVHLILATQKPSGVVDDQVWSNSRFKIALKVQEESDSKEVLKTVDAAHLIEIGRAILQVGNNEIYETFQSAYSGDIYRSAKIENYLDDRIYLINTLGQGELLNDDLSVTSQSEETNVTQIKAVIEEIKKTAKDKEMMNVRKPWLKSLDTYLVNEENLKECKLEEIKEINSRIDVGIIDIPERQEQEKYCYDLIREGNLVVFGTSGYGKTYTLTNMVLNLAIKNNPEQVNFYLVDYGNNGLIPLAKLPHVADYITIDNKEKTDKLLSILEEEIKNRRRLLAKEGVMNFEMLSNNKDTKLAMLVIVVDNFDAIKEMGLDMDGRLSKMIKDGANLGIYFILSSTKPSAIRHTILSSIKNRMLNYLFDSMDVISTIGRTKMTLPEIPGRAFVKTDDVHLVQNFMAVEGKTAIDYLNNLNSIVGRINQKYEGVRPSKIPVLPEELLVEGLTQPEGKTEYAIGLSESNCSEVVLDLSAPLLICGGTKVTRKEVLDSITKVIKVDARNYNEDVISKINSSEEFQVVILEDIERILTTYSGREKEFIGILSSLVANPKIGVILTIESVRFQMFNQVHKFIQDNVTKAIVVGNPAEQQLYVTPYKSNNYDPRLSLYVNKSSITRMMVGK